jgi:hypothetical protein
MCEHVNYDKMRGITQGKCENSACFKVISLRPWESATTLILSHMKGKEYWEPISLVREPDH